MQVIKFCSLNLKRVPKSRKGVGFFEEDIAKRRERYELIRGKVASLMTQVRCLRLRLCGFITVQNTIMGASQGAALIRAALKRFQLQCKV